MFEIENAIKNWKHRLRSNPAFEDGDIAELESHLREEIGRLKAEGYSEKEAFEKASEEIGEPEPIGDELYKSRATRKAGPVPPWKQASWLPAMLPNYFKIAFRILKNRKGYSFINIFGLAVGLAVCVLIGLYIQDELSYDRFHTNADRTYRVLREFDAPDLHATIFKTPPSLAPELATSVPEIEKAVRIARTTTDLQYGIQTNLVPRVVFAPNMRSAFQAGPQKYTESGFIWADTGFFEVFSFPVLHGEAALDRPGTVVLTEEMATKYFPNEDPVGQILQVGERSLEVTGVMENVPENTHLKYVGFVGSMETLDMEPSWGYNNFMTYIVLAEGASKGEITQKVDEVIQAACAICQEPGKNYFIPHLQPVAGIHLGRGVPVEIGSSGNILYVYIFGALAIFILLLSCINFMNLSTARSMERANEVGMRKTLGARRWQLVGQFLGESVLMSFGALVLALILCYNALPLLNRLSAKSLAFGTIFGETQVMVLIGLAVLVGLLAGSYPAFLLSRFQPTQVLKGVIKGEHGKRLRQGLVVFQFMISIAILVCTGVVYQQLEFMQSTGLGFNQENIIVLEDIESLDNQLDAFMQELDRIPGVQNVSSGYSVPGTLFFNGEFRPSADPGAERQMVNYSFVDRDYVETLDITLAAGRGFSPEMASADSMAVVLNESAVREFGWTPSEAVGKDISMWTFEYTVIGVMEDFHYESLHTEIRPLLFFPPYRQQTRAAIRVQPGNVAGTLNAIRSTWEQFSDLSFRYSFLADDLNAQYRSEERLAGVFSNFAILGVIIACLGLFGLAAYTAQQRTKEIGIRKVFGATVSNVVGLLGKDFLKLVLLGFLIAVPVTWYVMNQWLQDFAYRTEIGVEVFLLAGFIALLLALTAVLWQSIGAALMNPVKSLRSE